MTGPDPLASPFLSAMEDTHYRCLSDWPVSFSGICQCDTFPPKVAILTVCVHSLDVLNVLKVAYLSSGFILSAFFLCSFLPRAPVLLMWLRIKGATAHFCPIRLCSNKRHTKKCHTFLHVSHWVTSVFFSPLKYILHLASSFILWPVSSKTQANSLLPCWTSRATLLILLRPSISFSHSSCSCCYCGCVCCYFCFW